MDRGPEELKQDIEATRRRLSADTDALGEKVNPRRVVERRVDSTKSAMGRVRDKVMGTAHSGASSVGDTASSAAGAVGSAASSVGDTVTDAPHVVRERTQGSPLVAGGIAFAAGWLLAGLLPTTSQERQLVETAQERGGDLAGTVKEEVGQVAQEMKDNLGDEARDAVQQVRESATDAASTVRDESRDSAQQVAGEAKQSAQQVREGS